MHPIENAIAAIAAVCAWEAARWLWWEVESRRVVRSHGPEFWALLKGRFDEADEMRHCPPAEVVWGAECYEDEDWIS
jgi:hypothetical protein